jgi:hypothetical protein
MLAVPDQRASKRWAHRAVNSRIVIRADLSGIFQRLPRHIAGKPEDLQYVIGLLAADGRRGRIGLRCLAQTAPAPHTELAIALQVAGAFVDRVHVIPHAQQVGKTRLLLEAAHGGVDVLGRQQDSAVLALIQLDAGEQIIAVVRVADRTGRGEGGIGPLTSLDWPGRKP